MIEFALVFVLAVVWWKVRPRRVRAVRVSGRRVRPMPRRNRKELEDRQSGCDRYQQWKGAA
jgi:hypothetical protein